MTTVRIAGADAADRPRLPRRTLVGELLTTQLVFAAAVGLVAVLSVSSIAGWVVRDHLASWAAQWIEELDSLGGALYRSDDPDRYVQVERYVAKFPEIAFVRYYDVDGRVQFADGSAEALAQTGPLDAVDLADLAARPAGGAYRFPDQGATFTRMAGPIRVTSIASDGLFDVDSLEEVDVRTDVVGFVELALDYGRYSRKLLDGIFLGSAVTGVTFLALMLAGRMLLMRAVKPLIELEAPLRQLAEGALRIDVPVPQHREMAAIAGALRTAASQIRQRDRTLRRLANHDDLTGLPNRRRLEELLSAELRLLRSDGADRGALMFIDLDHFKYVNDTLGHTAGDLALRQVASRLGDSVAPTGVAARFGGDEFMVLLRDVTLEEAREVAERLLAELREYPVVCDRQSFDLQASIGIATLARAHSVDELLAQADMACHQAKSEGRNQVRLFAAGSGALESLASDLETVEKLKRALREDRFVLYFQPIQRLKTGEYTHYEVLLRLDEGDGLLAPGAFLPAAERFGLMPDIDRWVVQRALSRLAELRQALPGLRFTINVSGASFGDGTFDSFVTQALTQLDLAPAAVLFEITEQVAVGSFADATRQIRSLIDLGCEFAIDDFGAGYSSLNYLKQLPMQYIKIDGSFIRRLIDSPVDQMIVRAIADIARALGKQTVAEFVSNEAAAALLLQLGIDYAQGYYIGRPSPDLVIRPEQQRAAG